MVGQVCCQHVQVAKAEQDRLMLEKVTRDNAARLEQKAAAAEQARLEERRCPLTVFLLLKVYASIDIQQANISSSKIALQPVLHCNATAGIS